MSMRAHFGQWLNGSKLILRHEAEKNLKLLVRCKRTADCKMSAVVLYELEQHNMQ